MQKLREALSATSAKRKLSPKTSNAYRMALHMFFSWLVSEDRWPKNPVAALSPAKVVEKES